MTAEKGKTGVLLPLILIGAVFLSGVGLLGLLLQAADRDDVEDTQNNIENGIVNEEIHTAEMAAQVRYEESYQQAEAAKHNAPSEKGIPLTEGFEQPEIPVLPQNGEDDVTRSSDDLLEEDGFISRNEGPGAPDVNLDESISMLNGHGHLLEETYSSIKDGEVPEEVPSSEIHGEVTLPVSEEGVFIDDGKMIEVGDELEATEKDIGDILGNNTPDATSAGLNEDDLSGTLWDISNSTLRDSDGDGNPEWKYELRVSHGSINKTFPSGTIEYVIGFEYEYRDADSDGTPDFEKGVHVKMANFTANGIKIAEGIEYTEVLKNDTDGDGIIDRIEARHLSYGYHATMLKTIKMYAVGGELIMDDGDADGVFEDKTATAIFFYRHQTVNPEIILRESFAFISGEEHVEKKQLSKLAFTRWNNTKGETILEKGYIWSYTEEDDSKNLLIIAGKNNSLTNKVQYVIFNGTETVTDTTTAYHITAFAVENSTLLFGGQRSDVVAIDYQVDVSGNQKDEKGFLAAGKTDNRTNRLEESFLLISVDKTTVSGVLMTEDLTVLAGKNVTTDSLNSTMAFANKVYTDADTDGNPEYVKEAWAVGSSYDKDMDGNKDREAYIVHWNEKRDSDDDGNPEWNQTFNMAGWKVDNDDDGTFDSERGLMTNTTSYDNNSNGFVELKETGIVGFEKIDDDSDGTLEVERYAGAWEKVTDVNDDGTEINKEAGTWAHEE